MADKREELLRGRSYACYTLFVVIRKQRQNHFFAKKFEFCETLRKHIYDYSSLTAVFASNMQIRSEQRKKSLCFVQRLLRRGKTAQSTELVRKTSAKMIHTLFVFRNIFVGSSIFCGCSRIVCIRL